jgi:lipopolysaccharide export system protein LptA
MKAPIFLLPACPPTSSGSPWPGWLISGLISGLISCLFAGFKACKPHGISRLACPMGGIRLVWVLFLSVSVGSQTPSVPDDMIPITADASEFDLRLGGYRYSGNVVVDAPDLMRLTCEDLFAVLPEGGGRMERLVATTNVVIEVIRPPSKEGDVPVTLRAFGSRAVYTATNAVITLTGDVQSGPPRLESPYGNASGSTIEYDTASGRIRILGDVRSRLDMTALRRIPPPGGTNRTELAPER